MAYANEPAVAFGLDLAGYSTGRSALVELTFQRQHAVATIIRNSPFSKKVVGNSLLSEIIATEVEALKNITSLGPIAVDVPIDLQQLKASKPADFVWQLTKRPIDMALKALPPLADKLGAVVARFQAIMNEAGQWPNLGVRIFETYPSASIRKLGMDSTGYKGAKGASARARHAEALGFSRVPDEDELDAVICALAAMKICRLDQSALERDVAAGLHATQLPEVFPLVPKGYVLCAQVPFTEIEINECDFAVWSNSNRN